MGNLCHISGQDPGQWILRTAWFPHMHVGDSSSGCTIIAATMSNDDHLATEPQFWHLENGDNFTVFYF